MFAINSDRLSISSRIAWVTALVSPLAAGTVATALEFALARGSVRGAGWAHTAAGLMKMNAIKADCLMNLMIIPISTDV